VCSCNVVLVINQLKEQFGDTKSGNIVCVCVCVCEREREREREYVVS
jgi:hypothetical protein